MWLSVDLCILACCSFVQVSKVNEKAAKSLADPGEYGNLFPELAFSLQAETQLQGSTDGVKATTYEAFMTQREVPLAERISGGGGGGGGADAVADSAGDVAVEEEDDDVDLGGDEDGDDVDDVDLELDDDDLSDGDDDLGDDDDDTEA